jgi:hypothetical protein
LLVAEAVALEIPDIVAVEVALVVIVSQQACLLLLGLLIR